MSNLKDIPILVASNRHPPTLELLQQIFTVHLVPELNLNGLDEATCASIRGVAAMYGCTGKMIAGLPNLECISNFGVGYDSVDVPAALRRGICVSHTPSVLDEEVADTAMALLLNTVRELPQAEQWLRAGKWQSNGAYRLTPHSLQGRTLGIYGLGRIGKAIARRAEAFGMKISYFGRNEQDVSYDYCSTLRQLAETTDTLMIVAPATTQTVSSVNADILAALGPNGVVINIGRGTVVDEPALISALQSGSIAAAGLDVFANEPRVPEALLALPNAVLLPHVGSASAQTRMAMGQLVVDNLVSWFTQQNLITPVPEMNSAE